MDERRNGIRFESPFCTCIKCLDKESPEEIPGAIKDISYSGARLRLDTPLQLFPADLIALSIIFPDNTLEVSGKVVWVNREKKEVGVCFHNLSDYSKETIYDNIFKYFRKQFTQRWWSPNS